MSALAEAGLWLWLLVGPNGHLLAGALAPLAPALPIERFTVLTADLWLVAHRGEKWPLAFYASPELAARDLAEHSSLQDGRLLPGLWVRRLLLYGPTYFRDGALRPLESLAVDQADALFHALVEMAIEERLNRDPGLRQLVAEQAERSMAAVPAGQRLEAYLSAWSELGAHASTVAQQIVRAAGKAEAEGALCPALEQGVGLFGLWGRIFGDGAYHGSYSVDGAHWQTSPAALDRLDKELFLGEILDDFWSGEARRDFSWLCPEGGGGSSP